jgi:hypothetical protein
MSEEVARRAVDAFLARDLDGILGAVVIARVQAAKIVSFGFFRTEDDALEAVA